MSSDCNHRNPLQRSGVNQYQRVLAALLPNFVRVDERDYADLILFAKRYAAHLKYFNNNNTEAGNWQPFMTMDVSVTLAALIKLDIQEYYTYTNDIFDQIQSTDTSQEAELKNYFKTLFDLGFSITHLLDGYYRAIPADFAFREDIESAIQSSLPEYYLRLTSYFDESINQNILDPTGTFTFSDRPDDLILSQDFDATTLSDIWTDSSLPAFTPTLNGASVALKIKNTATHNLFTGIFDQYLKVLSGIVDSASAYLDQTLSDFPTHTPHYALYLTFIKLFRFSQDHLNTLTARHLDLYYQEILHLLKKEAVADKVHLTFELSKTANDGYLVEKDTVFKAGKDADDEEIFYALKEDVILGKATVSSLKNIFVKRNLTQGTRQVLASLVANSQDGLGAKLESADQSWKTFGDGTRPPGEVGFAVASHYLYLTEGTRNITFKFYAPAGSPITFNENVIQDKFILQLSGEKGWVEVPIYPSEIKIDSTKEFFSISVSLDGGQPPIVPYSPDTHEYSFTHSLPTALFYLKEATAHGALWNFQFAKIGIDLSVSGLKNLVIENDTGVLNPAKPFSLFGSSPRVGSEFMVGSKELFLKTLQPSGNLSVELSFIWDNYSELIKKISPATNDHKVTVEYLEDAQWKNAASNVQLFDDIETGSFDSFTQEISKTTPLTQFQAEVNFGLGSSELIQEETSGISSAAESAFQLSLLLPASLLPFNLPAINVSTDFTDNENYTTQSKWGFFKLKLGFPDFGHSTYASELAQAVENTVATSTTSGNTTTTTFDMDLPEEPYTPEVKEINLAYTASTEVDLSASEEGKILHIAPFGHQDISGLGSSTSLLPAFAHEGELFIGLDQLLTGQTLSVLFQVAEGTADPLIEKQEVQWYYLSNDNAWTAFQKEDISDGTNGLIKSGIIKFSVPDTATDQNTLMGETKHWLRVTVQEKTQAVCQLINVVAQAAVAEFVDHKQKDNYFKNTLPASTISKLLVSESAIKKIAQPYSSFGGKTKEGTPSFYRRVSERLRHKDRSIALWDYERLVLEEFPDLYKVKCITHTQIMETTSGTTITYVDNELKPGHVLVVPVPALHNKNAFDPLRPYTSLGTLEEVRKYLYQKISPHVNLDVRNPRFEEIQLEFNVQYLTDDSEFYTRQLKTELEEFLAPWAFDPETDIEFGGKVSKSVLINFIEERSYVDYISCVRMYQIVEGVKSTDQEEALATSSRSVFVSVKADAPVNHHIINETVCEC
jgi:hypothetical protein